MSTEKFCFVAADGKLERRAKYLLLLEKAKSIYFASQNQGGPIVLGCGQKPPEMKVFELVTKDSFHNEHTKFCPSSLYGKGAHEWVRAVVKFFYDNKAERFQVDLAALYFGKFRSFGPDGDRV